MFKKERDIEQDFKLYDVDKCAQKSRVLSMIIQVLIILLLVSLLGLVVLYGYKYLNQDKKTNVLKDNLPQQSQKPISVVSVSKPVAYEQNKSEKMYSQKEMQMIVQALMKEIEQKQVALKKETKQKSVENEDVVSQSSEQNKSENDSLVASLEKVGADQIEEVKRNVSPDVVKMKSAQKVSATQAAQSVDHYNKVIVKPSTNTYDDLAKLSDKISNVVKDMKKTRVVQQEYEEIINEEIATRANEMRIIVVQEGDTLSKIAQRAYGDLLAYDRIIEANPELIENPDRIYVGQRLRVPVSE